MPTTPSSPARSADRPGPGLRERKKRRTKAEIQRQALRLFQERGYAATTVEQIAAAAEVSPSTFFRYFATKDEVVLADFVDTRTFEWMRDAPADLSVTAALGYAVERAFGELTDEDLGLEMTRNALIRSEPELRRGMLVELTRPIGLLAEAIGHRLGRAADDLDARMCAGAVVGIFMALTPELIGDGAGNGNGADTDLRDAVRGVGEVATLMDRVVRFPAPEAAGGGRLPADAG